jgi:hypothetical protein
MHSPEALLLYPTSSVLGPMFRQSIEAFSPPAHFEHMLLHTELSTLRTDSGRKRRASHRRSIQRTHIDRSLANLSLSIHHHLDS